MNLLQLRRATRSRLGVPTSDQLFTDDILDDHINLANDLISSEHNWPWDEQVEACEVSGGRVLVPTDAQGVVTLRTVRSVYFNDIEVNEVSASDLMKRWGTLDPPNEADNTATLLTQQGTPAAWAQVGDGYYVRPVPATPSYVLLDFYATTITLVDDTDKPRMPAQFAGAIVAKACELLSIREDNRAASDASAADYGQWLTRMRRSLRRSTGPIAPRVREGSWI